MANVKKLLNMIERLEKGFSIEELDIDVGDKTFEFLVSFPKESLKGPTPVYYQAIDDNFVAIKGKGDIDAYYEKPYKASMEGPAGGGYEIGLSYAAGFSFISENGEATLADPKYSKAIESILEKEFQDEFLERITDKFEEERTAYRGD